MKKLSFVSVRRCFILFLLGGLIFTGCIKEEISETTNTIISEPQEAINTSIYGRVLDENNQPVSNALVTYQSGLTVNAIETDEGGYYFLENKRNKGKSAYLTVEKSGKFKAFRRLSVLPNRYNYTEIKMNDKTIIGQVSAEAGGSLTHPSGAKITLEPNSIIDATGNTYAGEVAVAMAWIDPGADDLSQRMVGDLSGIDEEGNLRSLGTYGMLQVELLDANGNELNIGNGMNAQLVFPVPASMQGTAPATIPLWSYDEKQGIWIEEGAATYENGAYVGSVSHFSSWNVDIMTDPIEISGKVLWGNNARNVEAGYLSIFVSSEIFGRKGGWLCENGEFLFYNFPKDEVFTLQIIDICGQIVYEESYGPFSENTVLNDIIISEISTSFVQFAGNAVNCAGEAVSNGSVRIRSEGQTFRFPLAEDGTFAGNANICANNAELVVIDLDELLESDAVVINDNQPDLYLENLSVCDNEVETFIEIIEEQGTPQIFAPASARLVASDSTGTGQGEPQALEITYESPNSDTRIVIVLYNYTNYTPERELYAEVIITSSVQGESISQIGFAETVTLSNYTTTVGELAEGSLTVFLEYLSSGEPGEVNITFVADILP